MDAVKFLKEKERMCSVEMCSDCHLRHGANGTKYSCEDFETNYPEETVAIVKKWSAEHPVKTRKSELLKIFPNVDIEEETGAVYICPKNFEIKHDFDCSLSCKECRKRYWLAEVE